MISKNRIIGTVMGFMGIFILFFFIVGSVNGVMIPMDMKTAVFTVLDGNPNPGTPFQAGNGTNFQVQAGKRYQIHTQSGFRLNLTVDEDVEMNMTEFEYYTDAPTGHIIRTMNRYMKIEMNQSASVNGTMGWEVQEDELNGLNRTSLRFAFHNRSRNEWQHVEQNWHEGNMVFCNTTHFSTWTITGELADGHGNPEPGTPFQASNGTKFQLQGGEMYQIRTQSGFQMNMSSDAQVNMTISEFESNPAGQMAQQKLNLGFFWNLSLEGTSEFKATLSWSFKQGDIQGMKGETLKFAYYDENSNTWKDGEQNWIEGNTVYCNTTHFSTWTVIGEEDSQTTPVPSFTLIVGLAAFVALLVPARKIRR